MKKIHLIRHAKSSWEDTSLDDIDRPLNQRGIKASRFMAKHMAKAGCCFDHVFCSPAVRAQATIELISRSLPERDIQWRTDDRLYTFYGEGLLRWFKSFEEPVSELTIIGHNPALTDLSNILGDRLIENIPTCGYVQLSLDAACGWHEVSRDSATVTAFLRPKKLMK